MSLDGTCGEESNTSTGSCLPLKDEGSEKAKSNTTSTSNEKHGAIESDPPSVESEVAFVPKVADTGPDCSTTGVHGYDDRARVHLVVEVAPSAIELCHIVAVTSIDKEEMGLDGNIGSNLLHPKHPALDPVDRPGVNHYIASLNIKRSLVDANVVPDLLPFDALEKTNVLHPNYGAATIKHMGVRGKGGISDVLVEHTGKTRVSSDENDAAR